MISKSLLVFITLIILASSSVSACTGFTATYGETTLVGNNNDWWDPDIHVKIHPPKDGKHGTIIVESKYALPWDPDNINKCGGMNDQGLFYEKFNNYPMKLPIKSFYKRVYRPIFELENYCLDHCSTVDEVIEIFQKYNLMFMSPYQSFFVDKNGDAVIIEGDEFIYKNGKYQVVTNFLQSVTAPDDITCRRYKTAVSMLENMSTLSVEYFTSILDAVHIDFVGCCTQDSQVYDLTHGKVYFYFSHLYDKCIVFNLTEEFQLGEHSYYVPTLFEPAMNIAPKTPAQPTISKQRKTRFSYDFSTSTFDNDNDQLYYKWDFGDGVTTEWIGPYYPYQQANESHTYRWFGKYNVCVKTRDIYGKETEWSDPLNVEIIRTKILNVAFWV